VSDLEELAVDFVVGFAAGFVAGFAAGPVAGFAAGFAADFVVDFVVDFVGFVGFEVEDLPPFLLLEARIPARVQGNTKTLRISIQNKFLCKKKSFTNF